MRTAGRGNRSAAAGADRMATSRARCVSADAVAASVAAAVTAGGNSATTAPAVASAATTPATATPTSPSASTFGQRGGYHQSTDRDSEHERAKNRHRVLPPSA
jgi:hypothetical protein